MKNKYEKINVEIRGLYDGVAYTYNPETGQFSWRDVAIRRTTKEQRRNFERKFLEGFLKENLVNTK